MFGWGAGVPAARTGTWALPSTFTDISSVIGTEVARVAVGGSPSQPAPAPRKRLIPGGPPASRGGGWVADLLTPAHPASTPNVTCSQGCAQIPQAGRQGGEHGALYVAADHTPGVGTAACPHVQSAVERASLGGAAALVLIHRQSGPYPGHVRRGALARRRPGKYHDPPRPLGGRRRDRVSSRPTTTSTTTRRSPVTMSAGATGARVLERRQSARNWHALSCAASSSQAC